MTLFRTLKISLNTHAFFIKISAHQLRPFPLQLTQCSLFTSYRGGKKKGRKNAAGALKTNFANSNRLTSAINSTTLPNDVRYITPESYADARRSAAAPHYGTPGRDKFVKSSYKSAGTSHVELPVFAQGVSTSIAQQRGALARHNKAPVYEKGSSASKAQKSGGAHTKSPVSTQVSLTGGGQKIDVAHPKVASLTQGFPASNHPAKSSFKNKNYRGKRPERPNASSNVIATRQAVVKDEGSSSRFLRDNKLNSSLAGGSSSIKKLLTFSSLTARRRKPSSPHNAYWANRLQKLYPESKHDIASGTWSASKFNYYTYISAHGRPFAARSMRAPKNFAIIEDRYEIRLMQMQKKKWDSMGFFPSNPNFKPKPGLRRGMLFWSSTGDYLLRYLKWILLVDKMRGVDVYSATARAAPFSAVSSSSYVPGFFLEYRDILNWLIKSQRLIDAQISLKRRDPLTYKANSPAGDFLTKSVIRGIRFLAHAYLVPEVRKNFFKLAVLIANEKGRKQDSLNDLKPQLGQYVAFAAGAMNRSISPIERVLKEEISELPTYVFDKRESFDSVTLRLRLLGLLFSKSKLPVGVKSTVLGDMMGLNINHFLRRTSSRARSSRLSPSARKAVNASAVGFYKKNFQQFLIKMNKYVALSARSQVRVMDNAETRSALGGAIRSYATARGSSRILASATRFFRKKMALSIYLKGAWQLAGSRGYFHIKRLLFSKVLAELQVKALADLRGKAFSGSVPSTERLNITHSFYWARMGGYSRWLKHALLKHYLPLFNSKYPRRVVHEARSPFTQRPILYYHSIMPLPRADLRDGSQDAEMRAMVKFSTWMQGPGWVQFMRKGLDAFWIKSVFDGFLKKELPDFGEEIPRHSFPSFDNNASRAAAPVTRRVASNEELGALLAIKKVALRKAELARLGMRKSCPIAFLNKRAGNSFLRRRATGAELRSSFDLEMEYRKDAAEKPELLPLLVPELRWHRFTSTKPSVCAGDDVAFTRPFRRQKKEINKFFVPDRNRKGAVYDRIPDKYYQFHLRADPLHRSFIIDKFVNAFTKHGEKKRIRALFYRLFKTEGIDMSPDSLLYVVKALMPQYLNVIARRGRIVYRAPIEASRPKSVMKAIKFFKAAALSRQTDLTIYDKIRGEFYDFMYWMGFDNKRFEEYDAAARSSLHLKHFRSRKKY